MNLKVVIWGVLCLVVTGRAEEIQMSEGTTAIPSENQNNPAQTTVATETQQDQVSEDKHPKLFVWKVGQVDYASENMVHGDTIRTVQDVKLVSQCAMHAKNTKDAMSFNFNKEQRICQINSESDTSKPASMRTEDGWQYFRQGTFQINQEAYGMCVTFPCMNGGECLDVVTSEGAMHYVCLCSPEYTGNTCEMPADSAEWGDWGEWSVCSVTCGRGYQTRNRPCVSKLDHSNTYNEMNCYGASSEFRECVPKECPAWDIWSDWSDCTTYTSCGRGYRERTRKCTNGGSPNVDRMCMGATNETEPCYMPNCHGMIRLQGGDGYGDGTVEVYNDLTEQWTRVCSTDLTKASADVCCRQLGFFDGASQGPTAALDGSVTSYFLTHIACTGSESSVQSCKHAGWPQTAETCDSSPAHIRCIVNGDWNNWSEWGDCSVTCENGIQVRTRTCDYPAPANGGQSCQGHAREEKPCTLPNCPVDGEWKPWADWDTCNETCGGGWQQRTRECQKPKHGGDMCPGSSSEIRSCNTHPCPVDGYWKSWQEWQECSEPCGGGKQNRTRDCVEPLHGGTKCLGAKYETRDCNTHECSINCVWNNWEEWEACNTTCGAGSKRRSRTFKAAQFGGIDCAGSAEEWTDCFDRDCPIDCMWHPWSDWASCNVTCGSGMQKRVRTKKTVSQHDGIDCAGEPQEWRSCNPNPCPVDCLWNPWSDWASCNVTCGGGMQKRLRTKKQEAEHSGVGCAGDSNEWRVCNDDVYCPVDGVWEEWSDWDTCSKTCGNGTQDRTRMCTGPFHDGLPCDGPTHEQQECYIKPCPVDGVWREWAEWSLCSRICGGGTKSRDRECEGPYFDGTECPGSSSEIAECNTHKCPENGYWEMWSSWSECNQMCGTGSQSRVRECIPPKNGGSTCDGIGNQDQECNTFPCPVDGVWDSWSEWDECFVLCGGGSQSRFRSCIEPLHGGKPCTGPNQEQQTCNENSCAVDGTWNAWSDWDTCNVTCGGGAQMRMRTCNEPLHGGADCPGDSQDWMPCNTHHCPIDGIWKEWSDWHECDVTCAGGIQFRFRDCIPPKYDGLECPGANNQSQDCNIHPCPVDGYWGEWAEWQSCNVSCGGGGQVRNRVCLQPLHGGTPCKGPDDNWRECNTHNCPIDCVWDEWSEWEACNVTCSNGHQRRLRTQQVELYGGAACEGSHDDWRPCFPRECPVDCYWDPWTEWEACSVTCGNGEHKRIRIKHPELHGGNPCQGTEDEWRDCFDKHCPIDCVWNEWSEWSECNVTCEEGSKLRTRTKVPAKYDGLDCPGNAEDWKTCNDRPCPIPGEWGEWSSWSTCTVSCEGGTRFKKRECNMTSYGWLTVPCEGNDTIWGTCNRLACLPRATTCGQLVERGLDSSMYVEVDPDGGELDDQRSFPPFYIYCDVEAQGGIGVAILHHNAEGRYIVQGFEGAGEYHSVLQYLDKDNATVHLSQVIAYVDASKECKQYISWECQSASIHSTIAAIPIPLTYWKNRYQLAKYYWGGNDPDYDGCQCGLTGTCGDGEDPDLKCNCDMNDEVWRKDDGWITHKDDLPISSIEAGDTGQEHEAGWLDVGPLQCAGESGYDFSLFN